MRKRQKLILAIAFGTLVLPLASLLAQTTTPPAQTFSTTIYLDYRYFLSSSGPATLKPADSDPRLFEQPIHLSAGLFHL